MKPFSIILITVLIFGIIYAIMEFNPRLLIIVLFSVGLGGLFLYIYKELDNP